MPHIPSAPTAELSILPFADAMARSGQSGGYDAEKWLYVPDFYTEYRYLLGTRGEKPLVCIGINPSTAEPDRLDPTLQSVERVAKNTGYDSFLMFNVWAAGGNIIEQRAYLKDCLADMIAIGERHGAQWYTAGRRSVKGHPHHPLYLKATSPLDAFDIRAYCAECL